MGGKWSRMSVNFFVDFFVKVFIDWCGGRRVCGCRGDVERYLLCGCV